MANDMVEWLKRAERGCARATEQVFRNRELIPSGPVAESESRVPETYPPSQVQKTQGQFGTTGLGGCRQRWEI